MKIIITSKNPVKIEATRIAFSKMFPGGDFDIEGVSISSDVSDQPLSDEETYQGALNRVNNAAVDIEADYFVGIEGGLQEKDGEYESVAWVVIRSKEGMYGKGRSTSFFLPSSVSELIKQGKELGDACDMVFDEHNAKQKQGTVGILTEDNIDRTKYYVDPAIMALIPFKNPDLY